MKIGINTLFMIPGQVGGTETYLDEILRIWAGSDFDHEVVLFTQLDNDALLRERYPGFRCELLRFSAENRYARIIREQTELPLRARRAGVDVLWSPGYTLPVIATCPQVVTLHDMQYKSFPEDLSFIGLHTTDVLVRLAARRASKVLAVSSFTRDEVLRYTAATPDMVHVTLEAADPSFAQLAGTRPEFADTPYLLCVANTYPHKAVDRLVRVFASMQDRIPHQLVLVGRPRLGEDAVKQALEGIRDQSRVLRLSGLDREELIGVYQHADVFVLPSLYEGFGLPVLEAMWAGVPVLATGCASIAEVGGDTMETYQKDSDEAMEAALTRMLAWTSEEREERIGAARTRARQFTWERCAEETRIVLEAACRDRQ